MALSPNQLRQPLSLPQVQGLAWPQFLSEFQQKWHPGDHLNVISRTGTGKTTFLVPILKTRKFVAIFDSKGGDSTLAKAGFERIAKWPPPDKMWERIERGEPVRIIIGPKVNHPAEYPRLYAIQRQALDEIWASKGWTVYFDELQMAADPRLGRLGANIEMFLIAARDRKISVVTGHQRTSWSPRSASEQSTWIATAKTRDDDTVTAIAKRMGRPPAEIRGAVRGISRKFYWLVVGGDPDDPIIVTSPPRL